MNNQNKPKTEEKGEMTVREAGQMGGKKVKRLVQEGEEMEAREGGQETNKEEKQK